MLAIILFHFNCILLILLFCAPLPIYMPILKSNKVPLHANVAISRVTLRGGLKILINHEDGDDTDFASNVVSREVFCNV